MFEIDFLPVGTSNGDAICVRHGDESNGYYLQVIDGGYTDTGDEIIAHIENHYGKHYFINNMVLTHADNDHACGLIKVLERFDVRGALWMNRPWLYAAHVVQHFHGAYTVAGLEKKMREMHPYLVELEKIAASKGIQVNEAFQGTWIGNFLVLSPSRERYIQLIPELDKTPTSYAESSGGWLGKSLEAMKKWVDEAWDFETLSNNPEPTSASNETSLVQLGIIDNKYLLFTADAGPASLSAAADYAESVGLKAPLNFIQVPHHGSRRNVTPNVLDRWLGGKVGKDVKRGTAICSVGENKDEYPRGQVKNAFVRRGYPVHATRATCKTHFTGRKLRDGWSPSVPEPFDDRVEV